MTNTKSQSISQRMMAYLRLVESRGGLPIEEAMNKDRMALKWLLVPPPGLSEYVKDGNGKRRRRATPRAYLTLVRDRGKYYVQLTKDGVGFLASWDNTDLDLKHEHHQFPPTLQAYRPLQGTFGGNPHKKKPFRNVKGNLLTMAKGA